MADSPNPDLRPDLTTDLAGQVIAEIAKVLGVVTAVVGLVWPLRGVPFWLPALAGGVVIILAGGFYAVRLFLKQRAYDKMRERAQTRILSEIELPGNRVVVEQALTPDSRMRLEPALHRDFERKRSAVHAMLGAGLMSQEDHDRMIADIEAQRARAAFEAAPLQEQLDVLKSMRDSGLMPESVYRERVAELTAQHVGEPQGTAVWSIIPSVVISIGFFLVLPAMIGLILLSRSNESAALIASYFITPAIILWIAAEFLFVSPFWEAQEKDATDIVGIAAAVLQTVGAAVLWLYVGISYGIALPVWVLGIGAALAVVGMVVAIVAIVLTIRRSRRRREAETTAVSTPLPVADTADTPVTDATEPDVAPTAVPLVRATAGADTLPAATAVAPPITEPAPESEGDSDPAELVDAADEPEPDEPTLPTSGQFELFSGSDGQAYFRLRADSGAILLMSEGYVSRQGCENGVASVKTNAPLDERYRRRTASDGRPFFALLAGNHRVIGVSQMYASEQARDAGITAVMRLATDAPLITEL